MESNSTIELHLDIGDSGDFSDSSSTSSSKSLRIGDDSEQTDMHAILEFNKDRLIVVTNVPDVTQEDIKDFVGHDEVVSDININNKDQCVYIKLKHGEKAEDIAENLNGKKFPGREDVKVVLCHNENLMCVTHLPFNVTEKDFYHHMEAHGPILKCFLIRHSKKGSSKGYGFVEFSHNREKLEEACAKINGMSMGSCIIACHFVPHTVLHFEDLHSKVLLVDHLPVNYTNEKQFEQLVSGLVEPVWCKLGIKDRQPLGFGLVQYITWEDAEEAQSAINGQSISGHCIRASFCTPGLSVQQIYNEVAQIRLSRMLPQRSPPPPLMPADGKLLAPVMNTDHLTCEMLKKLLQPFPTALQNLTGILGRMQIYVMEQQHQQGYNPRPGLLGQAPCLPASPVMNPNLQVALLAVLIAHQIQTQQPDIVVQPRIQQFILNQLSPSHRERPSLLGNPLIAQANAMLQDLVKFTTGVCSNAAESSGEKDPATETEEGSDKPTEAMDVGGEVGLRDLLLLFGKPEDSIPITPLTLKNFNILANALSGNKLTGITDAEPEGEGDAIQEKNPFFHLPGVGLGNPFLSSFVENLIRQQFNTIQFNMITSALNAQIQVNKATATAAVNTTVNSKPVSLLELPLVPPPSLLRQQGLCQQSLLGPAPIMGAMTSLLGQPGPSIRHVRQTLRVQPRVTEKRTLQSSMSGLLNWNPLSYPTDNDTMTSLSNSSGQLSANASAQIQEFYRSLGQGETKDDPAQLGQRPAKVAKVQSLLDCTVTPSYDLQMLHQQQEQQNWTESNESYNYYMWQYNQNMNQSGQSTYWDSDSNVADTDYSQVSSVSYDAASSQQSYDGIFSQPQYSTYQVPSSSSKFPDPPPPPPGEPDEFVEPVVNRSLFSPTISRPPNVYKEPSSQLPKTPAAPKGPHFLPSPEPSPEGLYVGQHSQGLGGHYSETHIKKKLGLGL